MNRTAAAQTGRRRRPWPPSRVCRGVLNWFCLAGILLLAVGCGKQDAQVAELSGRTMGTSYSVKLQPAPSDGERETLRALIDARLDEINRQMSTYQPDSDLMRFNLAQTTVWQDAPQSLVELVERANRVSELSDGMYDITVGPLVNLWGFGNAGSRDKPPTEQEIADLLPLIGYRHLHTRQSPPAVRKSVAGLQADLSSIAKGWAVDQIAALLRGRGFASFMVEIGGEVYARGEKRPGEAWRIAIERPLYEERAVQRVIDLEAMAVATSGDYRNFFPAGGRLYSHTIDPKSGQAVQHRLASVTVLADNCTDADAWATALMALGDRRAPAVAERLGLKVLFIVRTEDGFDEHVSKALRDSDPWRSAH